MKMEQAKNSIGHLVMSHDAGHKLIPRLKEPHGPYKLLKITKCGLTILEGRDDFRVPVSLLELFNNNDNDTIKI